MTLNTLQDFTMSSGHPYSFVVGITKAWLIPVPSSSFCQVTQFLQVSASFSENEDKSFHIRVTMKHVPLTAETHGQQCGVYRKASVQGQRFWPSV